MKVKMSKLIQNEGKAFVKRPVVTIELSVALPLFEAAIVPRAIPIMMARIVEEPSSSTVFGSLSAIPSETSGKPDWKDQPKSKVNIALMYSKN
jgi:hypothetical protein